MIEHHGVAGLGGTLELCQLCLALACPFELRHVDCCLSAVVAAVNIIALLPCRRHRSQRLFSKGVLGADARDFGGVPAACDPIRSAPQIDGGRINRLSHWTLPT
jgi:hypothetical protein